MLFVAFVDNANDILTAGREGIQARPSAFCRGLPSAPAAQKNVLVGPWVSGIIRRMTPPDVLRAITEAEIGREIIRLVPHWYEAECGPERYSVPIGGYTAYFYNHCKLTPNLRSFLGKICARTRELALEHFIRLPGLTDVLLENFAIEWLRIHSDSTDWTRLIKYLETLARRTYENQPVSVNLLIRDGEGTGDITEPGLQKFLDRLASSPFSYLTVDPDLRLIDYGEVDWGQIKTPRSYQFHPEFLHAIHSIMTATDFSAHLTAQGDLVIMNKAGLLAARRQRKWKVYDVRTFTNSLTQCLGNRHVGGNLFQVIFDLSFRRQGVAADLRSRALHARAHPQYGELCRQRVEGRRGAGPAGFRPGIDCATAGRYGGGQEGRLVAEETTPH